MHALVLCPERIGHGRPAGVGIRMTELSRTLSRAGHRVTLLSPDAGEDPAWSAGPTTPESIHSASRTADMTLVQGHLINELVAHRSKETPLVIDLYDPFLIENLHYSVTHPDAYVHDHDTTIRSLLEGDLFLCASAAQRLFWLGMLGALGRLNPDRFREDPTLEALVRIVPFGVPAPREQVPPKEGAAILFGGIYDWYRPELSIEAVEIAREQVPEISLTFVSHTNQQETPQSKWKIAHDLVERRGLHDHVQFIDWFSYDERTSIYDEHVAALLTFDPSIETDLSFRTRILDYLWGGLPVVSSSARETNRIIEKYGTGRVIRSNDPERIANALVEIVNDSTIRSRMVDGTERFSNDYQWDLVAAPLLDFCERPSTDSSKRAWQHEVKLDSELPLRKRIARKLRRLL